MNTIAALDVVSTAAFLWALAPLVRSRAGSPDLPSRFFLGAALLVYVFVGLSNVLEHAGVTDRLDRFEDYAEDLFIPLLLFALYSLGARIAIDKRVAAEEELRQSRERYRTLVENVDLGISLVDRDFNVLMANPAYGRFFGRSPEEFLGRKCFEVFEGREAACRDCPGTQALASRRRVAADKDRTLPDGTEIAIRILAFPVLGPGGEPEAFIEVLEDRTERRAAEVRRRQVEARLLENERLSSLVALAGGISHDFNNLLMSVLGNTEMALMKMPADSPLRPYCKRVESAALRASELTRQLTAYSGKPGAEFEPLGLGDLLRGLCPLAATAAAQGAVLRFLLEGSGPVVRGDVDLLRQVLMILVLNASEALEGRPGAITLRAGTLTADRVMLAQAQGGESLPEGPCAFLEVEDLGRGLEPGARRNLFDPFYTTKAAGRGLGLPAALGIVEAHGGAIAVESEPGRGARFRVLLPALDAGVPPSTRAGACPVAAELQGQGKRRVLVVDGEATTRTVTRMAMEELGFRVDTALDEREAFQALQEQPVALAAAIIDVTTARESARLLGELRSAEGGIPMVLTYGRGEQEEAARLGAEGFAGLLEKPYRRTELVTAVARALPAGSCAELAAEARAGPRPQEVLEGAG